MLLRQKYTNKQTDKKSLLKATFYHDENREHFSSESLFSSDCSLAIDAQANYSKTYFPLQKYDSIRKGIRGERNIFFNSIKTLSNDECHKITQIKSHAAILPSITETLNSSNQRPSAAKRSPPKHIFNQHIIDERLKFFERDAFSDCVSGMPKNLMTISINKVANQMRKNHRIGFNFPYIINKKESECLSEEGSVVTKLRRTLSLNDLDYLKTMNIHVDLEKLTGCYYNRASASKQVTFSAEVDIVHIVSPDYFADTDFNFEEINEFNPEYCTRMNIPNGWKPLFTNPIDLTNFSQLVSSQKVRLEQVYCAESAVYFSVRVYNLSFEKTVQVYYTQDKWKTTNSVKLSFREHLNNLNQDIFSGFIGSTIFSEQLEFYVVYEVNGDKFYDSYDHFNYVLVPKRSYNEL